MQRGGEDMGKVGSWRATVSKQVCLGEFTGSMRWRKSLDAGPDRHARTRWQDESTIEGKGERWANAMGDKD